MSGTSRPLPPRKPRFLGALLFTHMTQGLTTTLPYVIAVYMVRDFLAAQDPNGLPPSEERVGKLTGYLGACFCFAQLITSYPVGMLSDVVGRRIIIIIGNISCVIGVLFFGLSSNYTQAILSRLCAGLFNAIIGAEKAMIGESLDSADQAKAMGYISLMWGIGTMIGPTLGGLLANPCHPTTGVLRALNSSTTSTINSTNISTSTISGVCSIPDGLFYRKPYFLPCLAASSMSVVATLLTICYLDETREARGTHHHPKRRGYMRVGSRNGRVNSPDDDDEEDNNFSRRFGGGSEVQLTETVLQIDKEERRRVSLEDSAEALNTTFDSSTNKDNNHQNKINNTNVNSNLLGGGAGAGGAGQRGTATTQLEASLPWFKQTNVLLCLAGYASIAFCYILLDELIPIYASAQIIDGGLGFPTSKLALPLAFGGLILVVWALFGFPWMNARLGVVKCTTIGLVQTVPLALMIPLATMSFVNPTLLFFLAMGAKAIAGTNAFTGSIILVNAASPKESLGAINGVGQTLASAVRAAGPALGGLFWAWSLTFFKSLGFESAWGHQFLPFLFAASVAVATLAVYAKVKMPLEKV